MGFASGSVTFRRFAVVGKAPQTIDEDLLDRLTTHRFQLRDDGVPDEEEYGWCGGRHIFDGAFSFEHNVFNDCLFFGLRIDVNKVPGDVKRAYQMMEEDAAAAGNPSGFISKNQKRDVKDIVRRKIDEDLKSGRFRRSKMVPLLWDVPHNVVYCAASGASAEKLMEIFERTFELSLQPLSAGSIALHVLEPLGKRRDYEDFRPTRFVHGPEGESQVPEYPWVAKGPEPKDFLGNEFLLWLWHQVDAHGGIVKTPDSGEVTVYLEKSLDLDCAYGQTGKDSLKGDGPTRMPEAIDALRSGKLPRKSGMILHAHGQQFELSLNPESFAVGAAKLPEVEEAENPRVLFEERITLLRDLCKTMDALYHTFLKLRASSSWETQTNTLRRWIQTPTPKPIAAVA